MTVLSSSGNSYSSSSPQPPPPVQPGVSGYDQIQAKTAPAGVALINGTQTLLTWNTPNDGQAHKWHCVLSVNITVAETGGHVQAQWTSQGVAMTSTLLGGGGGTGNLSAHLGGVADPGTAVKIVQDTALTAGAAQVSAIIDGM